MAIEQRKQWQRVSWGRRDGNRIRIFEALAPLPCGRCREVIQPGDRFSRVLMSRASNFRLPYCRACLPFVEDSQST